MSTWDKFASFWTTYGPWIGAVLVPTIITGLSISPKLEAEAPVIQKIWDVIKQVMTVFSVVTAKDAAGTFQLPLKVSHIRKIGKPATPPSVPPAPPSNGGPAGPAVLVMVFLAFSSSVNCGWLKHESTVVVNDVIDCAKAEEEAVSKGLSIIDIATQVIDLITKVATDWESALEGLITKYGGPIVACSVQAVKTPAKAEPGAPPDETTTRKEKAIASHHWTFKKAE